MEENDSEKFVCEMAAILFRLQYVEGRKQLIKIHFS